MLSFLELAARPEFAVAAVDCRDDHRGWTAERPREDVRLVFVRRGGFRRRVRGVRVDLDPTVGYLGLPGDEEYFAHPDGGDTCTSISLTPALWRTMAGDAPRLERSSLYVDGRLDLAHRRLLAATRAADTDHAATEGLIGLLATVVRQIVTTTVPDGDRAATGDRTLVAKARRLIGDGHPATAGLVPLATQLGVSPYRLSRAFTRELGITLTRYRNRVRVAHALDRLEAGEPSLAALAADLRFADQAHLCRTMREHLGHTPTALRRLLT
ncbi:helix-turn-helix domain-containing protein [Amycolatopsis keratiniphila]|uniref:helix-turn-helix domain-containing protein n=1 Tax=Amycolatopsis keratiniphila TaxID=129921 RepID=UPI0008793DBE|nr:helix-turn-helix domain-containing protein [Amycolatopsis keratiniphila]OLZ48122.1 AraC family transcriptional regulator [Amycolatopsis keratiniphila subsp. nogabecina]SDU26299.1 AraC-type DNA-binding protein [Amycolatopsis keratiniphila]